MTIYLSLKKEMPYTFRIKDANFDKLKIICWKYNPMKYFICPCRAQHTHNDIKFEEQIKENGIKKRERPESVRESI